MASVLVLVLSALATTAQAQTIAGYGPVNLDDVSPLTISWNQVHYLVRDNLLEIDQLRTEHEDLYRELQSCFGLERCLRGSGVVDMDVAVTKANYGAGSILASLQREREALHGKHVTLEAELREKQRVVEYQRRQQQQQQQQQQQEHHHRQQQEHHRQQEHSRQQEVFRQQELRRQQELQRQQDLQRQQGGRQRQHHESSSSSSSSCSGTGRRCGSVEAGGQAGQRSSSSQRTYEYSYEYSYGQKKASGGSHRPDDDDDDYSDAPLPGRG